MLDPNENYYEMIGVAQSASLGDIQKAIRKARLRLQQQCNHSDIDIRQKAERIISQVLPELEDTLTNPIQRKKYDDELDKRTDRERQKHTSSPRQKKDGMPTGRMIVIFAGAAFSVLLITLGIILLRPAHREQAIVVSSKQSPSEKSSFKPPQKTIPKPLQNPESKQSVTLDHPKKTESHKPINPVVVEAPKKIPPSKLAAIIQNTMHKNGMDIHVDVDQHYDVTLSGKVTQVADRERARIIATSRQEVRSVMDHLIVTPALEDIAAAISKRLAEMGVADSISASVSPDYTITFKGALNDESLKRSVLAMGRSFPEVKDVKDQIFVVHLTQKTVNEGE